MLVMVIWLGLCTCWCRPAGLHRRSSSSSLASEKKIRTFCHSVAGSHSSFSWPSNEDVVAENSFSAFLGPLDVAESLLYVIVWNIDMKWKKTTFARVVITATADSAVRGRGEGSKGPLPPEKKKTTTNFSIAECWRLSGQVYAYWSCEYACCIHLYFTIKW